MASKQAQTLVRDVLLAVGVRASEIDIKVALHNVDAELAEVREVLEGLQTFWIDQGDNAPVEWHWCDPDADCTDDCQRARELFDKLKTD